MYEYNVGTEKTWLLRLILSNYFSTETCDNHARGETHSTSRLISSSTFLLRLADDFRCKLSLFQHIKSPKELLSVDLTHDMSRLVDLISSLSCTGGETEEIRP